MFEKLKNLFGGAEKNLLVCSPLNGKAMPIQQVNDPTFSEEILGKGIAILPTEGKLYAPIDGKIEVLTDTLHAVALVGEAGLEILIHVGLDTVKLQGEHFTAHVAAGDQVKKGDLLLSMDLQAIQAAGYDVITPIIVTNTDQFASVNPAADGNIKVGDPLLSIDRK